MNILQQKTLLIFFVMVSVLGTSTAIAEPVGNFEGEFVVKWMEDGRNMRLLNDVTYTDPRGLKWTAPKGTITDGASIPQSLWSVIGTPFGGKYRNAAVIHDHFCMSQVRAWRNTHRAYYEASLSAGVSETAADLMYFAVYRFGPRWETSRALGDDSSKIVFKPRVVRSEFEAMKKKIENRSVSIKEIETASDRRLRTLSRSIIE